MIYLMIGEKNLKLIKVLIIYTLKKHLIRFLFVKVIKKVEGEGEDL